MGEVLLVEDRDLKRRVAMKLIREEAMAHVSRFMEEVQVLGQLEHPNIVPLYDVAVSAGKRPLCTMRYVRGKLVLRLHREPSDAFVERLNDEFADILESGRINKAAVHRLEADDEHLTDLPRLALEFDRRSIGRLREMVDLINDELGDENHTDAA